MGSPLWLLDLLANIPGYLVAITALVVFVVVWLSHSTTLDGIPTVGSTSWFGSWWASLKFLINATDTLQKGYEKHKPAPFKVAGFYRWIVVLTSREHIEELRRAHEDTLSFAEATNDWMHLDHILGRQVHRNPFHALIIRSRLTRNIETLYPEIIDEITAAFDDMLDLRGNERLEWKSIPVLSNVEKVVCRTTNRVLLGFPLCRHSDWIDLNIRYTADLVKAAITLGPFPNWLKPVVLRFFTNIKQINERARKLLGPVIEERLRSLDEHGNEWAGKPHDFLSWLMEEAEGPELTVETLMTRILLVNFAAIHTTSNSFTQTLFCLAANPQYIQPLRDEVETLVDKEGWSKAALDKMWKVDSFLKECQRFEGFASVTLLRNAVKDYTFSDGTFVPKGTTMFAAARCIHRDETFYKNADTFEPFRFSDMRAEDSESVKYDFVSTASEYLPFGHGRHACPGRFFAASELKSMLAHIVVMYDVKLADNAPPPRRLHLSLSVLPDPSAKVMFRRRVT